MFRKYILPALAVVGVLFGVFMVFASNRKPAISPPVSEPATSPYPHTVTGAGMVESATENIAIGAPVAGVVTAVYARVGDEVSRGFPYEFVRRFAPRVTVGDPDEAYDDMLPEPGVPSLSAATQPTVTPEAAASASTDSASAFPATQPATRPARVDLNTASMTELAQTAGLGWDAAERVVKMRDVRKFTSIWDLCGSPLFKVDDRAARADLAVQRAAAEQARQKLAKLLVGTRKEEVDVARAQQEEAKASWDNARRQFERWARVEDQSAVPPDEIATRRSAMLEAEAKFRGAKANLAMLEAGAWDPDIQIARSELLSAEAQVRSVQTEIERLTVRAPVDGRVLQVKIRPGEYATAGVLQTPLMLVGHTDVLHIRTDIDEHEAQRVTPTAAARANVRGDARKKVDLQFVRIEPYVVPKRNLTGDSSERVDTRVLQVIYSFNPKNLTAYVGQQMDVFIEAKEGPPAGGAGK